MSRPVIRTTAIPEQVCPACGDRADCATGWQGRPEPGAWVVCAACGSINRFDAQLRLRLATVEELAQAPAVARQLQAAIRRDRPIKRGRWQ